MYNKSLSVCLSVCLSLSLCLSVAPSAPTKLSAQGLSASEVLITWRNPLEMNGIVIRYDIAVYDTGNTATVEKTLSVDSKTPGFCTHTASPYSCSYIVSNLKPYRNYTFVIQAVTIKPGKNSKCTARTTEGGKCWMFLPLIGFYYILLYLFGGLLAYSKLQRQSLCFVFAIFSSVGLFVFCC